MYSVIRERMLLREDNVTFQKMYMSSEEPSKILRRRIGVRRNFNAQIEKYWAYYIIWIEEVSQFQCIHKYLKYYPSLFMNCAFN